MKDNCPALVCRFGWWYTATWIWALESHAHYILVHVGTVSRVQWAGELSFHAQHHTHWGIYCFYWLYLPSALTGHPHDFFFSFPFHIFPLIGLRTKFPISNQWPSMIFSLFADCKCRRARWMSQRSLRSVKIVEKNDIWEVFQGFHAFWRNTATKIVLIQTSFKSFWLHFSIARLHQSFHYRKILHRQWEKYPKDIVVINTVPPPDFLLMSSDASEFSYIYPNIF